MKNLLRRHLLSPLLFFALASISQTMLSEKVALVEDSVSAPSGLGNYWIQFMEKRSLGLISGDEWYSLPHHTIVSHFQSSERLINGCMLLCPEGELLDKHPLVFWVVHGTWAQNENGYCSSTSEVFQGILGFAAELAVRKKQPIEVVSYGWSGVDSHEARRKAGAELRIIAKYFFDKVNGYGGHWAFGHSHGVNVILTASQEIFFESVISLGAPVLENVYMPLHVGCIYHFYSLGDPWQKAGSVDLRSFRKFFSSLGNGERVYSRQAGACALYNFRVMLDALDPGHVTIKLVVPYLWQIFDTIKNRYLYHTHFNLNVVKAFAETEKSIQVSIRDRLELIEVLESMTDKEVTPENIAQLKNELSYSKRQAIQFSWQYRGKNINSPSVWWRRILANWLEFGELLQSKIPFLNFNQNNKYSLLQDRFLRQ